MVLGSYNRTRDLPHILKGQREITGAQKLIPVFPKHNLAMLQERTLLRERRSHLPCPPRWISVPRRIMATTSAMRRLANVFTLRFTEAQVKST
jgi:hypothetical protein